MRFGWIARKKSASPGKATRPPWWSDEPKTYEQRLEDEIDGLVSTEAGTPARFARECMDPTHERWQEAWDLYYEWVEHHWKRLAMAHAGQPLTDQGILKRYGSWQDRDKLPGKVLYDLVRVHHRPGHGWMH
jgi:hypothetical protein